MHKWTNTTCFSFESKFNCTAKKVKNQKLTKIKLLPDLQSKFWAMLESKIYATKAYVKNVCIKNNQMIKITIPESFIFHLQKDKFTLFFW